MNSFLSSSLYHSTLVLFVTYTTFLQYLSFSSTISHLGNETDRSALLHIKSQIKDDPLGLLRSWNDSLHFCNWTGITCDSFHQRVTNLNLSSYNLVGPLSPYIGNLTLLQGLNIEQNFFHGYIPLEIARLTNLNHLNLSNNSFTGEIPSNISGCFSLVLLRLGFNNLTGRIPYSLGSLQKLEKIQIHYNRFTGQIPESLGNLSTLRTLSMSINSLEGRIPESLGRLKRLNFLGFGLNRVSGTIPLSVFNLSSLRVFTLPFNRLHGTLPTTLGFTLPNLQVLNIGHNQFTGPLPVSVSNLSSLLEMDIDSSNFTGEVNIDFSGLSSLWVLALASNPLGTGGLNDLSFMKSLSRCKNMQVLDLSNSQFSGQIPSSIANLSTQFRILRLGGNRLVGSIPPGIGNLVNLSELAMDRNNLTGSIPSSIGNLKLLRKMDLSSNFLSGVIPSSISSITNLFELHLQNNYLTGQIPSSFRKLQQLQDLDLSQNHLNGSLPKEVMALSSLTISLNLSRNRLTGSLPNTVSGLKNLGSLDFSENKLSGEISRALSSCVSLEYLHLEGNSFQGSIPLSFSSLRGLRVLDLSRNNLSGEIPEFLSRISFTSLNLSSNNLSGNIPTSGIFRNLTAVSVTRNPFLCGGVKELNLPPCSTNSAKKKGRRKSYGLKLFLPLFLGLLGLVALTSFFVVKRLRKLKPEKPRSLSGLIPGKVLLEKVSFESLFKATEGFSTANFLGSGSFGTVYRGILENQTAVAVKVLHMDQRGALKSFLAECQALKNIKHRNLVDILTLCSSTDYQGNEFKALIFELMPNGSLEEWLHPSTSIHEDLRILSLLQRISILIDVASALEYLHYHCDRAVVHCDLKPSNILLDADMTAHLSDFGLSRFIQDAAYNSQQHQSISSGLKGTVGYAPPEYGMGSNTSIYGDVYSYGIIILEMFTGKRPTDEMFKDGLDLHFYVKNALPEHVTDILDPLFVAGGRDHYEDDNDDDEISAEVNFSEKQVKGDQVQQSLVRVLTLGVDCSAESPRDRMRMGEVVKELQFIRTALLASGLT